MQKKKVKVIFKERRETRERREEKRNGGPKAMKRGRKLNGNFKNTAKY